MEKISRRGLLKGAVIAGVAGATGAWWLNARQTPKEALDNMFNDALTDLPAASISAALIKNGQMVWGKGFGYQNLDSGVPATLDSIWPSLGSVSKLITWTALMQLVENGKVDLHGDVSGYFGFPLRNPDYPETPITPYHLLTHSSSLSTRRMTSAPDSMADFFCSAEGGTLKDWVDTNIAPDGLKTDLKKVFDPYRPGDFPQLTADPLGVLSGYSNLNAMVAAYLIEQVSQMSFEFYTRRFIFEPISATDMAWTTSTLDQQRLITPYEAKRSPRPPVMAVYTNTMREKGYLSSVEVQMNRDEAYYAFTQCEYDSPFNAAGLLGSSTVSLVSFLCAFLPSNHSAQPLLKVETMQQLWQMQRLDPLTGSAIGLGWFRFPWGRNEVFWGHDGGGPGILSRVMIDPYSGDGLVLLLNNFFIDFRKRAALLDQLVKMLKKF